MLNFTRLNILFMFFFFYLFLGAKENKLRVLKPDMFTLQSGGNLGAFSAGINYCFGKKFIYDLNFSYGYTPSKIGGNKIEQLTLKNTFVFPKVLRLKNYTLRPHLGLHITYNLNESRNVWLELPSRYPDDFYFSTALQGVVSLGLRHEIKFGQRRIIAFMDTGTTALYIRSFIYSKNMELHEILSSSFGLIFEI